MHSPPLGMGTAWASESGKAAKEVMRACRALFHDPANLFVGIGIQDDTTKLESLCDKKSMKIRRFVDLSVVVQSYGIMVGKAGGKKWKRNENKRLDISTEIVENEDGNVDSTMKEMFIQRVRAGATEFYDRTQIRGMVL